MTTITLEVPDYLATSPSPRQIIEFKISDDAQDRLEELLEKNREEGLTAEETAELDVYELVHHSMIRLKAQRLIWLRRKIGRGDFERSKKKARRDSLSRGLHDFC